LPYRTYALCATATCSAVKGCRSRWISVRSRSKTVLATRPSRFVRTMRREAQARANEERAQRDRDNVDDMATFCSHARGWPASMSGRPNGWRRSVVRPIAGARNTVVMPLRAGAYRRMWRRVRCSRAGRGRPRRPNADQSAAGEGNVEAVVLRSRLEAGVQQCVLVAVSMISFIRHCPMSGAARTGESGLAFRGFPPGPP